MICYFKLDRSNRPILLFCTAVKSNSLDVLSGNIKVSTIKINDKFELPSTYRIKFTALKPKLAQNGYKNECLKCQKHVYGTQMVQLKYSYIVKKYEEGRIRENNIKPNKKISYKSKNTNNIYEKAGFVRERNQCIPPVLKKIYPLMSYDEYKQSINHYDFMDKTVLVCHECYIKFMRFFGEEGGGPVTQINSKLHQGQMYKLGREKLSLAQEVDRLNQPDEKMDDGLWVGWNKPLKNLYKYSGKDGHPAPKK